MCISDKFQEWKYDVIKCRPLYNLSFMVDFMFIERSAQVPPLPKQSCQDSNCSKVLILKLLYLHCGDLIEIAVA